MGGNPRLAVQMGASIDHLLLLARAADSQTVIYAGGIRGSWVRSSLPTSRVTNAPALAARRQSGLKRSS